MQNTKIAIIPTEGRGPEYIRMPRVKERDPIFGLCRSQIYELVLPSLANDWTPPVRSVVLRRKPGSRTGVRLVHVGSLRAYIEQHLVEVPQRTPSTPSNNNEVPA
jgi:hypothetical protein